MKGQEQSVAAAFLKWFEMREQSSLLLLPRREKGQLSGGERAIPNAGGKRLMRR